MADNSDEPVELEEPDHEREGLDPDENIWMRGLWMVILALMFGLAETVLLVMAVVQFFWMVFAKEKNMLLADFGDSLGGWLRDVARFQTGATEDKPFPWKKWD